MILTLFDGSNGPGALEATPIAQLSAVTVPEDHSVTVTDLKVDANYQGRGVGTWAMWWLMRWAFGRGIERIEWSDCSDRCRQPDNLYLRLGATYKLDEADPDMEWSVRAFGEQSMREVPLQFARVEQSISHPVYFTVTRE